ncbi:hypothetical protein CMI37_16440 [Candidatus Pacearchaeota archaeon]|nr:hypothetical protein [Candidatus Pacearchaeota archaeon]|tara:strand:+ start:1456 stop:2253 length:798 start_codon:yes stop_codon:yes gene_type:complete
MSNDKKDLEQRAQERKRHLERLEDPRTQERWKGSYQAALTEPERLLEALTEFCYGGEEAQADLERRIQEQRVWVEGLSFGDWWRYGGAWPRVTEATPEGQAWRKLAMEARKAANPYLRKEQCVHGHVYRIRSRNLSFGAYNEQTGGFNGIREKFGRLYIFEEYHWDNGPPFGTVHPQEDLGPLPEGIEARESLGCAAEDGRRIWFDREARRPEGDVIQREYGRNRYKDTNEFVPEEVRIYIIPNQLLFEHLEAIERGAGTWAGEE